MSGGKFPREFVLNGVDIRAPGIQLGCGTKVQIGAPKTEDLPRDHLGAGSDETRIRVTFPITVSFETTIVRGGKYHECAICDAVPPMPDEEALVFLLRNHDGARLVWPDHEGCKEERDRYPVTGWRKHRDPEEDESGIICDSCHDELKAAKAKIKKARRGT